MAVKIRLKRMGAKKQPFYRIVVADARSARDGRYVDAVGFYNPLREPAEIRVDADRALEWLRKGAQPSEAAKELLRRAGVWERWTEERSARKATRAAQPSEAAQGPEPSAQAEAKPQASGDVPEATPS